MWTIESLLKAAHHAQTGRVGQPFQLAQRVFQRPARGPALELDANQNRGFLQWLDINCLRSDRSLSYLELEPAESLARDNDPLGRLSQRDTQIAFPVRTER